MSRDELQSARDRYISDLLYPHNTVLDDSIGCALWFAARGVGYCARADDVDQWMFSTARLLFSGIGADELLGGYSRHRGAWHNGGGMEGVIKEISLDIDRFLLLFVLICLCFYLCYLCFDVCSTVCTGYNVPGTYGTIPMSLGLRFFGKGSVIKLKQREEWLSILAGHFSSNAYHTYF